MHAPLTITVITLGKGGQFLGFGANGRRGPKLGEHCLAMAHLDTFNSLDNGPFPVVPVSWQYTLII